MVELRGKIIISAEQTVEVPRQLVPPKKPNNL